MTSFYGGPQGASMIITKRFDAIEVEEDSNGVSKSYRGGWFACRQDQDGQLVKSTDFYVYSNGTTLRPIERNEINKNYYPNWKWLYKDGTAIADGDNQRCVRIKLLYDENNKPTTNYGWECLKPSMNPLDNTPLVVGIIPDITQVLLDTEHTEGMVNCFKKGASSVKEVGFGQYVLIDTSTGLNNPNDPDNGKIYRRGLDYQYTLDNPLCGAEYLGRFNGAKGESPEVNINSVDYIKSDKVVGEKMFQEYKLGRYEATSIDYYTEKPTNPQENDIYVLIDESTTPISVTEAKQYINGAWIDLLNPNTKFNIADLELIKNNYINSAYDGQYVYVKEKSDNYLANTITYSTSRSTTPTEGEYVIQLPTQLVRIQLPYYTGDKIPEAPTNGQFWIYQEDGTQGEKIWVMKQYSSIDNTWTNIDDENICHCTSSAEAEACTIEQNLNKYILVVENETITLFAQVAYNTDQYILEQYTGGAWIDLTNKLTVTLLDVDNYIKEEYLSQYIFKLTTNGNILYQIANSGVQTRKLYKIGPADDYYIDLLPGKYSIEIDGQLYNRYNDAIEYAWCNVKDEQGNIVQLLMGFKFPFPIFEWDSVSVDPYYHRSDILKDDKGKPILDENGNPKLLGYNTFTNEHLLYRTDDAAHPFYEAFKLHIPSGKHGLDTNNYELYNTKYISFKGYELVDKSAQQGYGTYNAMLQDTTKLFYYCTDRHRWYIRSNTTDTWKVQNNHRNLYYPLNDNYILVSQTPPSTPDTYPINPQINSVYYSLDDNNDRIWYKYTTQTNPWVQVQMYDYSNIPINLSAINDTFWFDELENKVYHIENIPTTEEISDTSIYLLKDCILNQLTDSDINKYYASDESPYNLYCIQKSDHIGQEITLYHSQYKNKEVNEKILGDAETFVIGDSNITYLVTDINKNNNYIQVVKDNNIPLWLDYYDWFIEDAFEYNQFYRIKQTNYERFKEGESWYINVGKKDEITDITLNEIGDLDITYNQDNENYYKHLQWISDVVISDQKNITFYYNDGTIAAELNNSIKKIEDISIQTDIDNTPYTKSDYKEGSGDQRMHIKYNVPGNANYPNQYEEVTVGAPINYVMEMTVTQPSRTVTGEVYPNYHMLILYSDPAIREKLADTSIYYKSNKFDEVRNDWVDLGYVRGSSDNFKIAGVLSSTEELKPNNPPELIMNDDAYAGWSFVVDDSIYIYNYESDTWNCVYTFSNKMLPELTVYVDNINGSDLSNGSYNYPYLTIEKALKNKNCATLNVYLKGKKDALIEYAYDALDFHIVNTLMQRDPSKYRYYYVNTSNYDYFATKINKNIIQIGTDADKTTPTDQYIYYYASDLNLFYTAVDGAWVVNNNFKIDELPTQLTIKEYGYYYYNSNKDFYYIDRTLVSPHWYSYNDKTTSWEEIHPYTYTSLPVPDNTILDNYYIDESGKLYKGITKEADTTYVEQQYILNNYQTPVYTFKTLKFINNTNYELLILNSKIEDLVLKLETNKTMDIQYSTLTRVKIFDKDITLRCGVNDNEIVNIFEDCDISVKEYQSKWTDTTQTLQSESRTLLKGFTWFGVKYITYYNTTTGAEVYTNMIYYTLRDYARLEIIDESLVIVDPEGDPRFTMENQGSFVSAATPKSFIKIPITKYKTLDEQELLLHDQVEYIITLDD